MQAFSIVFYLKCSFNALEGGCYKRGKPNASRLLWWGLLGF